MMVMMVMMMMMMMTTTMMMTNQVNCPFAVRDYEGHWAFHSLHVHQLLLQDWRI